MPASCIHMEKIERFVRNLKIERSSERGLHFNFLNFSRTYGTGVIETWLLERPYEGGGGIDEWALKRFPNKIKDEIFFIINECNCRSENNQQLILRRNAETEKSNLEVVKRSLEGERDRLQSSVWSLQSTNSSLQNQLTQRDRDVEWGKGQLVIKEREKEQFKNERDDYKNKWFLSESEVKKITDLFNNLQIEENKKETEIISLKEELESLQNVDISYKERKLDELIRNSGLNNTRPRIINLRDSYVNLYNRDDIVGANREIETIKAELFQTNVDINDLHKIYKTCEKIAELRVKQEKLREQQQQYEAKQEVPPRN